MTYYSPEKEKIIKFNFKQAALKPALVSAFALGTAVLGVNSPAYAANVILIGKAVNGSNDINTLTINQSRGAVVNRIGETVSDRFNIDGKWSSINITQTNEATVITAYGDADAVEFPGDADYVSAVIANFENGNVIAGSIKKNSTDTSNTATLVQTGAGNRIALAVGADVASTGKVAVGISKIGNRNSSTYTMNHLGNVTVAKTTGGGNNVVKVTSSGGTNYSNTIAISGSENKVTVDRSGGFTTNTDSITLTGALNTVTLSGTAIGTNAVTLVSSGNNNVFGITQNGANSKVNVNVETNFKNVNVTQLTVGSLLDLTGTFSDGGLISIAQ